MGSKIWREIIGVVGPYAVVAGTWILVSDRVVLSLFELSPDGLSFWQTIKGLFFVLATSCILGYTLYRILSIRIRKEAELCEVSKHYQALVENVPGMVYQCLNDPGYTMRFVSREAEPLTGYRPEELVGNAAVSYGDLIVPEDREYVWETVQRANAGPAMFELNYRIRRRDGEIRHVTERGRLTGKVDGSQVLEGVVRDVTVRREQESQLQQQLGELSALNETMTAILDNAPVMTALFDPSMRLRWISRCWVETLGWSIEEYQEIDLLKECYPDPEDQRRAARQLEEANGSWADFRTRTKEGKTLQTSWANIRLSDGSVVGIGIDLTEQRRLEVQRERFFEQAIDPLCIGGFDGWLREVNPAWTRVLGWSKEELTSRPWLEFVHPEDREETIRVSRELVAGRPVIGFENRYLARDRSIRRFVWNAYPVVSEELMYGVIRDVTELRLLEKQLFQAQKMEAVGRFAAGIAHDFNNVLTAILWTAEIDLSGSWAKEFPERAEALNEIREGALRGGELTRKLLLFGRQEDREFGEIRFHELLDGIVRMVSRMMDDDIEIEVAREAPEDRLTADSTQVEQVMMNLLINARDAMPNGGKITITTRIVPDAEPGVLPDRPGGESRFQVEVRDNGTGMDEEVLKKIFDPFFTTKERGRGTGLGLSTAYAIVRRHRGTIEVDSEPGKGTAFRITFPLSEGVAGSIREVEEGAAGEKAVLLVEDDARMRGVASRILARAGYRVEIAASVGEARKALADGVPFNVLITDVHLPDGNGVTLAADIRHRCPDLPILFISGDVEVEVTVSQVEGSRFLKKPFKAVDLVQNVEAVQK